MTSPHPSIPEAGYYYHYKHDPNGEVNNYAYYIYGAGHHTEEDDMHFLIYRPLYESAYVYRNGKMFDVRPLNMFFDMVDPPAGGNGKKVQRFERITDEAVIRQLEKIKEEMYA